MFLSSKTSNAGNPENTMLIVLIIRFVIINNRCLFLIICLNKVAEKHRIIIYIKTINTYNICIYLNSIILMDKRNFVVIYKLLEKITRNYSRFTNQGLF
jgi:hypothetical protein